MNSEKTYDFPLQQNPSIRAQELLYCEIDQINNKNIFPLTPQSCSDFVFPKSKAKYESLARNSIKQLKYVVETIQNQDQDVAFSLDEIVE